VEIQHDSGAIKVPIPDQLVAAQAYVLRFASLASENVVPTMTYFHAGNPEKCRWIDSAADNKANGSGETMRAPVLVSPSVEQTLLSSNDTVVATRSWINLRHSSSSNGKPGKM